MKITKRQLKQIIKEEKQKLNESFPERRMMDYERSKQQPLKDLMSSIQSQIIFIEGQLGSGRYDYKDIFDYDFGHMAGLADLIDAAREKAAEEGVPFAEPNLSGIEQYSHRDRPATVGRWSMNESQKEYKMKITKQRLRRIIREGEEKQKTSMDWFRAHNGLPKPTHMSGRNQGVMEQLHTAIDALIDELTNEGAFQELQGIVDEWDHNPDDERG